VPHHLAGREYTPGSKGSTDTARPKTTAAIPGYNEMHMNQVKETTPLEKMIRQQIVERGITDSRVVDAMRTTPRELFFRAKSVATPSAIKPPHRPRSNDQPALHGRADDRQARSSARASVLEIGTGSGYQTAILSKLAGEVFTVERVKPLLDAAWERLMDLATRNVHFHHGDGTLGWKANAPFDRILITAGAPDLPESLFLEQLKDNGVAILPVGPEDEQMLVQVVRHGDVLETTNLCPCRFVN